MYCVIVEDEDRIILASAAVLYERNRKKVSVVDEKSEILNFGGKLNKNWLNDCLKFVKTCTCSSSSGDDVEWSFFKLV